MDLENEDFSSEDEYQYMYTWEFFAYIFFGIKKAPTLKIPEENFLCGNFPGGGFPGGSLMVGNLLGGNSPKGKFS